VLEAALRRGEDALEIRFENYHTIANRLCMEALDAVCVTFERMRQFTSAQKLCFDTMLRFLADLGPGHATIKELHERSVSYQRRYERYSMQREDLRSLQRYEHEHMEAEDHRSREKNVAKLNSILHAGSLLGIKFLRMFALKETGTFELDFWLAVEDFRRLALGSVEFEVEVRRIFKEFIAPPQILSMLTEEERDSYRKLLAGGSRIAPTPTMYDSLQGRVLRAIANGWFERFEKSVEYENFREAMAMQEEGFFREGDTALNTDTTPLSGSGAGSSGDASPQHSAGGSIETSPRP